MAMMDSAAWNPHDHQGLHSTGEDDFQQFLDMGSMANLGDGLQFDFQEFQNAGAAALLSQAGREQIDTPMGGTDAPVVMTRNNAVVSNQMGSMGPVTSHPSVPTQLIPAPLQSPADAIVAIDAQIQYLQQQKLQQQQQQIQEHSAYYGNPNQQVPPTPQSLEIQPNGHPFFSPNQLPRQQAAVYDNRSQRLKEQQDMAFTPLVSPAVTPLDPNFPVDATYTVPGAYFSPLTSPALHAQNDPVSVYEQGPSSTSTNSPGNTEMDPALNAAAPVDLAKKARKNNATKANRKGGVRQSPISKPQRRKTGSAQARVSQVLSEMTEGNGTSGDKGNAQAALPPPEQPEENESVSPEDLSDMPPPPLPQPRSAGRSPFIHPQNSNSNSQGPGFASATQGKPSPATPATLMKLPVSSTPNSTTSNPAEPTSSEPIENFELPESANFPKPKLSPLDTQARIVPPPSSEPGSARTATFQPLPSPVFAKPTVAASASQSPQLLAGSSPAGSRKTPQLAARSSKKRSSVSSVHVSPALRPKISPNIKPLLPGAAGVSAEDTASRLLASKSNYQNILEGNTVPGVSYPSELSTNLTSKRTSHKIAEQGRRNRINTALQEIATLLPKSVTKEGKGSEGEGSDKKDGKSSSIPNSKASTVEMAIEYIKQLQQELTEANKRAEAAEKKLEMQGKG